jgi:MIP family channel proteins
MIMAAGHISGGLFNPALVVGLVATRRLSVPLGIGYIVVELLGGIAGALLLGAGFTTQQLDAVKFGTPLPAANLSIGQAILIEAVLTFFLMFSVFGNAIDPRSPKAIAGLAIGLTITMDIFGGGGLTGAAMNPARSIGPELVGGIWDFWYVYWIGPIVGAVIAALIYEYVLIAVPKPVAEAPHP